jgi:hypothetical protein
VVCAWFSDRVSRALAPTVDGITSARPLYENLVEDDIVFFQFTLQNEGQGVVSNWYFTPIGITKIS